MRALLIITTILFGITNSIVIAQDDYNLSNNTTKPVVYERINLTISAGVNYSKLRTRPNFLAQPLLTPYVDLALTIPVRPRWRLRTGIVYQAVGQSFTFYSPEYLVANHRLDYLIAHLSTGYSLCRNASRYRPEVTAGFFVSKQLQDVTVNRFADRKVILPSIESSVGFNYGVVMGFNVSTLVTKRNRIGLNLLYYQGLLDIRTELSKQKTGTVPYITHAFTLCTFLSI